MSKKHLFTLSGLLALTTIVSGTILSATITHADDSIVDTVEVTVNTACTLSSSLGTTTGVTATTDGEGNNTYTTTMNAQETKEINASIFSTVCNDSGGYSLYAIGYSGNSYDAPNNTKMLGTDSNINTSTATTGGAGSWSMKLAEVSGYTPPTILNNFNNYHVIPDTYTQIAKYTSTTASAASPGATVQAKYQIYTGAQPADTYTGKVKYTIVHPNTAPAPTPPSPINPYCTDEATCMQTSTACDTTLTDGRDGATYTTATIAGTCWMTQNLRFQGTDLKVGESDVTSDITMTYGQLTSGNSYTEPRIATGSTTDYGTYYNYCAASAGEVCDDTTQQDATRSVCPAGWKLPTQAQLNALPQYDSHFTASSGLAGLYNGGSLRNAGTEGYWWASTAGGTTRQQNSLWYTTIDDDWSVSFDYKYLGLSVRCVRAS